MIQQIGNATLHLGDCLDVLRTFADNSVDSIVTDPPYGLSFMGKKWDYDVPSEAIWAECLRVLKPGGHLLAFAGTRTQHRMACRIEDAGFEIRDMIAWVYGSGFPKSLDVSKAIDKAAGAEREVVGIGPHCGLHHRGGVDSFTDDGWTAQNRDGNHSILTTPATEAAKQWQGWGTALKPSLEPITMARKPFACTVAANVLQHGTGALNIDASRVGYAGTEDAAAAAAAAAEIRGKQAHRNTEGWGMGVQQLDRDEILAGPAGLGRWPANLIHDGSAEVLAVFVETGPAKSSMRGEKTSAGTHDGWARDSHKGFDSVRGHNDSGGSAARFFYCAKASAEDRNEGMHSFASQQQDPTRKAGDPGGDNPRNRGAQARQNHHPTVKPTDLMRYLLRLVTPPHGVALDPFLGSGSTGKAAMLEDLRFIGIERDPAYFAIACARLEHSIAQGSLFAPVASSTKQAEAAA
jgi:site-specific DNA-methyltransferase (adenine-specific)